MGGVKLPCGFRARSRRAAPSHFLTNCLWCHSKAAWCGLLAIWEMSLRVIIRSDALGPLDLVTTAKVLGSMVNRKLSKA